MMIMTMMMMMMMMMQPSIGSMMRKPKQTMIDMMMHSMVEYACHIEHHYIFLIPPMHMT